MARKQTVRDIIRFTDSDVGKQVTFSPHKNSVIYELFLEGKSGVVKKVTNRLFDQQIIVDFAYLLKMSPQASVATSIFKTADRDLVIKSINNHKVTFCRPKSEWNSEKNAVVHGVSCREIGGKEFDFVEEKNFTGGIYFGLNVPTTQLKYVYSYHHYPPIGPEFSVSADDLIFK